jgi:hypothetical protein
MPTEADWDALRHLLTELRHGCDPRRLGPDDALPFVRRMVADAVAAESERCARLAETLEQVHPVFQPRGIPLNLREQIATAIREGRGP